MNVKRIWIFHWTCHLCEHLIGCDNAMRTITKRTGSCAQTWLRTHSLTRHQQIQLTASTFMQPYWESTLGLMILSAAITIFAGRFSHRFLWHHIFLGSTSQPALRVRSITCANYDPWAQISYSLLNHADTICKMLHLLPNSSYFHMQYKNSRCGS